MNARASLNLDFQKMAEQLGNAGVIERWHSHDDGIHVLLKLAVRCTCREMHYWFVNRDGRTRCVSCDERFVKERAAKRTAEAAA